MSKVSIIGAGQVGSTLAMRVVENGLADVVLIDVLKSIAIGKSLDILDASPLIGHERSIVGTDNFNGIKDSDIVVITAGLPRRPGMTREELIAKNVSIVCDVASQIKIHAPSSIIIVVTNPLDSMTYLVKKITGFDKRRIFGMAGDLDGARFIQLIADELKVKRASIGTYILGSHGDTMVPIVSRTYVSGKPIKKILSKEKLDAIVKRTRERGLEIVSLLGSGSAYFSPSAAIFRLIDTILKDRTEEHVVSAYLDGEYGLNDICIGVPCKIGRKGIKKVIELGLTEDEKRAFLKSAENTKSSIAKLRHDEGI